MRRQISFSFFLSVAASAVLTGGLCLAASPETPPSPHTPPAASADSAGPAIPGPATKGQQPPDSPEVRAKLLADLYAHLATAEDEIHAKPMAEAIERLWLHSGSDTVDVLMQRAYAAIQAKRHDLALKLLDAVVELAPDFAEGWNRRAYVYYSQNEFERALGDLRRALALEPNHFKALDGLGQIMKELGSKKAALKAFKELMAINPNFPGVKDSVNELQREVEGQGI
jgi:tetratricopeptide (TPR) repeat protein